MPRDAVQRFDDTGGSDPVVDAGDQCPGGFAAGELGRFHGPPQVATGAPADHEQREPDQKQRCDSQCHDGRIPQQEAQGGEHRSGHQQALGPRRHLADGLGLFLVGPRDRDHHIGQEALDRGGGEEDQAIQGILSGLLGGVDPVDDHREEHRQQHRGRGPLPLEKVEH